jgi:Flp pilus assembly protein TadB
MIVLAALAGALVVAGLLLLVRGLRRTAPPPGTPPRGLSGLRLAARDRRQLLVALGAAILVFVLTGWPVGGLAAGAAVAFLPRLGNSQQRQRTAMLEGLEQWIRRLADMITASRGLEDALSASARSAPAAVAGPVNRLAGRLASRIGTEAALRAFAAEIDDPAGDRIAAALIIATGRRGGGSRDVLVALAALLARDVAARREIDAERAQHRTTVRWIGIFIAGFTAFSVLNRSYSAPFGTVAGQVVLAVVALLYAGGLLWLHRLGNLPAAGRFLDDSLAQAPPPAPAQLTGGTVSPGQAVARRERQW